MYIPYFWRPKNEDEFIEVPETETNCLGIEPTAKACPEGFRDYYNFLISHVLSEYHSPEEYDEIMYSKEKLGDMEVEWFRKSKAYQELSSEKIEEIEQYMKDNPFECVKGLSIW